MLIQALSDLCVVFGTLLLSGLAGYGLSRAVGRITVSPNAYKRIELLLLIAPPVIIGPWVVMSQISQQLVIEQAVGPGAWERGVRLIDDDGTLNNGARLSPFWNSLVDPGGLILAIGISSLPAFVWTCSAGPPITGQRARFSRSADFNDDGRN